MPTKAFELRMSLTYAATQYVDAQPHYYDAFCFCFDVPSIDGMFAPGTLLGDVNADIEDAYARCYANRSHIESLTPPGGSQFLTWYQISGGMGNLRRYSRDFPAGTIEGAVLV